MGNLHRKQYLDEKRILFVTGRISGGGAERVLVTLANEFSHRGYKVVIAQTEKDIETPYKVEEGVGIEVAELKGSGIGRVLNAIHFVRNTIKRDNYDYIISFMMNINVCTLIACMGLNKPVFVSERCDPGNLSSSSEKMFYLMSKFLYRFAKGIVFQTEYVKKYYSKVVNNKSKIIMNPIKDSVTRDESEIKKWIVNAGRLSPQKNQKLLIDSFYEFHKTNSNYELHILGDGELRDDLQQQIDEKGLSNYAFIHGFVVNVEEYYRKAKMFVLTSDYEGIPNAMLEAMAVGVPVICTDCPVGGVRQVVENEYNGLLVKINDKKGVVNNMNRLASDDDLYKMISEKASEICDKYSIERIIDCWEKLLNG